MTSLRMSICTMSIMRTLRGCGMCCDCEIGMGGTEIWVTKAEGELWVQLYNRFLKRQQPFVAMHTEWQKHVDEDQILYRTNAQLRKFKETAKRRNWIPQDEEPEGEPPNRNPSPD